MHPDVSVILNIHRESGYVLRTLRSLDEAASFARHEGIHSELIVVLDRSDELTRNVTKSAACCGFESVHYVEADHGSLGLARNMGIAAANGKYIWTADGDDLVSYNCIATMHAVTEATPRLVVFPEYRVAFGDNYFCIILVSQSFPSSQTVGIPALIKERSEALANLGPIVHVVTQSPGINGVDFENGVWVHRVLNSEHELPPAAATLNIPQSTWNWSATVRQEVERISQHREVSIVEAPILDCQGIPFWSITSGRW